MASLPNRLRGRSIRKPLTVKDFLDKFECPRCQSTETEETGRIPWVNWSSKPARIYSINKRRCKGCGFKGDEEMFKV